MVSAIRWLVMLLGAVGLGAGLYFAIRFALQYSFAQYALILHGRHGMAALRQSRSLAQNRLLSVAIRLIVPKLIYGLSALLIEVAATTLYQWIITATTGAGSDLYLRFSAIGAILITVVIEMIINPLFVITDTLVYKDLEEHPIASS